MMTRKSQSIIAGILCLSLFAGPSVLYADPQPAISQITECSLSSQPSAKDPKKTALDDRLDDFVSQKMEASRGLKSQSSEERAASIGKYKLIYKNTYDQFNDTHCIDLLAFGLISYDLYFRYQPRSLGDYRSIVSEYEAVSENLELATKRVSEVKYFDVATAKDELATFGQRFNAEKDRTNSLVRRYKIGLGVGIGLTLLGAGLLAGGIPLIALDGQHAQASGCPIDGRDLPCITQTNKGLGIGLAAVGGGLLAAGIGDLIGIHVWLGKQSTPAPELLAGSTAAKQPTAESGGQ